MEKIKYVNRYNEEYTFSLQEDLSILWEGPFNWMRSGWANDYTKAYSRYKKDLSDLEQPMTIEEFKESIHTVDLWNESSYKGLISLVEPDLDTISMVDPSGGPYIGLGSNMSRISPVFENLIVSKLESLETGYLITVEKK